MISSAWAAAEAGHAVVPFYADPKFWVAMGFLATVVLIGRKAYNGIVAGLDQRSANIRETLAEAERLRDEAQAMLTEYQRKQREALRDGEAMVAQARDEAEQLKAKAAKDIDQALARMEQQAKDRIAHLEAETARQVRDQAVTLAMAATQKAIAASLTDEQASALVDEAIADVRRTLN